MNSLVCASLDSSHSSSSCTFFLPAGVLDGNIVVHHSLDLASYTVSFSCITAGGKDDLQTGTASAFSPTRPPGHQAPLTYHFRTWSSSGINDAGTCAGRDPSAVLTSLKNDTSRDVPSGCLCGVGTCNSGDAANASTGPDALGSLIGDDHATCATAGL